MREVKNYEDFFLRIWSEYQLIYLSRVWIFIFKIYLSDYQKMSAEGQNASCRVLVVQFPKCPWIWWPHRIRMQYLEQATYLIVWAYLKRSQQSFQKHEIRNFFCFCLMLDFFVLFFSFLSSALPMLC